MKKRKFAEGGRFEEDTYARAKRFLRESGAAGETPALDEMIASKRVKGPSASEKAEEVMAGLRRESEARTREAPKREPSPVKIADTGDETARLASRYAAPGKFTDADESERASRRAAEEEENLARINRVRMKAMEREQALEPVQPEMALPIGKAARLAQAAAGAASSGIAKAEGAATAQRAMTAANKRAAAERAEQAGKNRASESILRRAFETMSSRRAAETRERAQQKAKDTLAGSAAKTRAAQERRQDMLDEMRMGGEGGGFKKGGMVGRASKRADGIAMRGKTRGRMI